MGEPIPILQLAWVQSFRLVVRVPVPGLENAI